MKNNNQPILKKPCQYSYTGCQKTAVGQRILKLGTVTIDKGWICANCRQIMEKERLKPS